jgi:hypothetical protein
MSWYFNYNVSKYAGEAANKIGNDIRESAGTIGQQPLKALIQTGYG